MSLRRTVLLIALVAAAAHARLVSDDPQPLGPRTPVVLIHGWIGGDDSFTSFQTRALADKLFARRCRLYRFVYDWQKAVATSADKLRRDLDAAPELTARPVVLVGHSMGGLVARALAEGGDPDRCGALITLGTPHHGSPGANLEWLRDDSSYWLASRLVPLGMMAQLNRIPMVAAALTEGGRDMGWDNYDFRMPTRHWAGANRYLRDLNARFDLLPAHDELLLRYALHAAFLSRVPALSPTSLAWLVHEGEYYPAGAALVAHAFRDGANRTIDEWTLNDGIVPLDSAAFLLPGDSLLDRTDGTIRLNAAAFAKRQRRPGLVTDLLPGVDHTGLHGDALAAQRLRQELERIELNGLALQEGGRITLYRPHDAHPEAVAAAPAGAELLAAPAPDLLLAAGGDALLAITPGGARTVARAAGADGWSIAPDGRHAVSPDNALVGVTTPSYRRLIEDRPACPSLWSPDGRRVALADPLGELVVAETGGLRQASTLDLPPASRPVAWSPTGNLLLCGPPAGLLVAAFRPDGAAAALLYPASSGLSATLCNAEGRPQRTLATPPQPGATGAALALWTLAAEQPEALSPAAASPSWSADGTLLAWIDGPDGSGVAYRRDGATHRFVLHAGRFAGLAIGPRGMIYGSVAGGAAGIAQLDPASGAFTWLSRSGGEPAGAPLVSPDGCYVAAPLAGGTVLLAEFDGTWEMTVAGSRPHWLPLPAARAWTGRPVLP